MEQRTARPGRNG